MRNLKFDHQLLLSVRDVLSISGDHKGFNVDFRIPDIQDEAIFQCFMKKTTLYPSLKRKTYVIQNCNIESEIINIQNFHKISDIFKGGRCAPYFNADNCRVISNAILNSEDFTGFASLNNGSFLKYPDPIGYAPSELGLLTRYRLEIVKIDHQQFDVNRLSNFNAIMGPFKQVYRGSIGANKAWLVVPAEQDPTTIWSRVMIDSHWCQVITTESDSMLYSNNLPKTIGSNRTVSVKCQFDEHYSTVILDIVITREH